MQDRIKREKKNIREAEEERSNVIGLGFCGPGAGSNTGVADIKDGKIVRLRPLHYDWKYDKKQLNPWKKEPAGMKGFYDDPDNNRLQTPSGKIEFCSQNLAKYFPDDEERPPVPHWIEKGSHDERVSSTRAKKYPLLVVSNHGRWRVHADCDDITWTRECPTCKVKVRTDTCMSPSG